MKTLIFHGSLRTLCPENIEVEASTVAEAISSLQTHPAFRPGAGKKHFVSIDGFGSRDAIYDVTNTNEIHIRPAMAGSGGGWTQIIIGAIIIAAALATPGGVFLLGSNITGSLVLAGASIALGGVLQMIAPQPTVSNNEKSRYLGAAKNTVTIGTRIPLIYGTRKAFGHYISFDIDSGDFNSTPDSWYASPLTDFSETTTGSAPAVSYSPDVAEDPRSVYTIGTIEP